MFFTCRPAALLAPLSQGQDAFARILRPVVTIGTPILKFDNVSQAMVGTGAVGATIALDQALDMPGISSQAQLEIVLSAPFRNVELREFGLPNTDTSKFTIEMRGSTVTAKGFGDLTTGNRMERYARVATLQMASMNLTMTVRGRSGGQAARGR